MNLNILGHDYEVQFVEHNQLDTSRNCGTCDMYRTILAISTNQSRTMQESTIIHEIIEAVNYCLELNLEHNKITALESGLYQVLKDNKLIDFSKYIK
jgi:hypothetical protein